MQCAGFVLAGGGSRRMGRDKALLPWRGSTLIQFVAGQVLNAAGSVTLIGNPDGLAGLGYPVIGDLHPGCGPLGGLETALRQGQSRVDTDYRLRHAAVDGGELAAFAGGNRRRSPGSGLFCGVERVAPASFVRCLSRELFTFSRTGAFT